MSETLEQIAERLAPPHSEVCRSHASGVCDCWRTRQRIAILAALREAEARGEQRAAALGGALLDSAKERAEKAEAEHGVLRRYVGSEIYMSDFRSVSQMRAALNKATALAAERMELLTVAVNTGAAAYKRAEQAERDLRDIIENDEGQRERANKLEAEVEQLKEAIQHYVMVAAAHECDCDDPDKCSPDDDTWRESDTGELRHGFGDDVSECESYTLREAVDAGHIEVQTFEPCAHDWYGDGCEQCATLATPADEPKG